MKYLAVILILGLCGGCLSDSATYRLFPGKEQHPIKPPYIEGPEPGDPDYVVPPLPSIPSPPKPETGFTMSIAPVEPIEDTVLNWTLSIPIELMTSEDLTSWTVETNVVWEGTDATVLSPMTEEQRFWSVRMNGQIIRIDE